MLREEAQRSSTSRYTNTPVNHLSATTRVSTMPCCMRQTLPVPGVPAIGLVHTRPDSLSLPSVIGAFQVLPHSKSVVQRQKPESHFEDGQSVLVAQRRPL